VWQHYDARASIGNADGRLARSGAHLYRGRAEALKSMRDIPTVETERLLLRGWREMDLDIYAAFVSDEEVTRYIGGTLSRPDAWRVMAGMIGHWTLRGFGLWALERKSDGAFIGQAGLLCPEGWPGIELAWMLGRPYWGQGFATEAAKAAAQFGFQTASASKLISLIHAGNLPSQKVARRIHETKTGHLTLGVAGKPVKLDVWEINRERWQSG
jgi:RimJ/RimL family protein N-acetyltransferase